MSNSNLVNRAIDLVDQMDAQEMDELVDYIRGVFKTKRMMDNARANARLKVGDRVKLTGAYKPQYLRGLTGVIESKKNTRVEVRLDNGPVGKFRSGVVIATPGGLTKIED